MNIYTDTAITRERHEGLRCFGWYDSFEKAELAVLENRCDIHECWYHYVVIEKFNEGIHPVAFEQSWYIWDGEGYKKSEKPVKFNSIVNFGLG